MTVRVIQTDLRALAMHTRMPFRYGIATLTSLPHLFVRVEAEVDGRRLWGVAADGLAPKWFTKNPATSPDEDIAEMIRVVEAACDHGRASGSAATVFELWQRMYQLQQAWGDQQGYPPLLWGFGTSLVERALIDAFCRARGLPFAAALRNGALGFEPGALHPELGRARLAELLPAQPPQQLIARHTVGLSDPLEDADVAPAEQVGDGLPQSLVACVRAYGLTHFKIKLSGDPARDLERLGRIAGLLAANAPGYRFTLDGNEQFGDVASFRSLWVQLRRDEQVGPMLSQLLFVEQPLGRDVALSRATARELADWPDRPPLIIDESDGAIDSLPAALSCGYAGASHKNCKGVFKGAANACLLRWRRQADRGGVYLLSGEDLSNVGPVALLQDLAVMATLGIDHVERNGHHYFAGLSMFPADVQEQVLTHHGDLYRRHQRGYATLAVTGGKVDVGSLLAAPFGQGFDFDAARYARVKEHRPYA